MFKYLACSNHSYKYKDNTSLKLSIILFLDSIYLMFKEIEIFRCREIFMLLSKMIEDGP